MLIEHYITAFNKEDKEKYKEQVYKIIEDSYASIGGVKNLTNYGELLEDKYFWKLVRKNNKIVAAKIYKNLGNSRKSVLAASDGTIVGKEALYGIMKEDIKLKDRGAFIEISGPKMEYIQLEKLDNVPIPVNTAIRVLNLLGKDAIPLSNEEKDQLGSKYADYYYKRLLGGEVINKMMVGNVEKFLENSR